MRAPDTTPAALTALRDLQRHAGNRALAELMRRPSPGPVQREPFGYRPPAESAYRLHLDPEIEAQIRTITAMQAWVAPLPVQESLREVDLNLLPPTPSAATSPSPLAVPPPAPSARPRPVPAPGTGLTGPRAGTGGDIWQAVLAEPALGPAIQSLGEQAAERAKRDWAHLSTGEAVAVVTQSLVIGGATITGVLSSPDARRWIATTLADKVIPVPKVPGLGVQLNLAGNNLIVGLHLDVGKLLPASLGFGPASQNTPLGAPPNPVEPVQRRLAVESPVRAVVRSALLPVVQRDGGSVRDAATMAIQFQPADAGSADGLAEYLDWADFVYFVEPSNGVSVRVGVPKSAAPGVRAAIDGITSQIASKNRLISRRSDRVELCLIVPLTTQFALLGGTPVVVLDVHDANAATAVHEMGHAILHSYRKANSRSTERSVPVRAADIFLRLEETRRTQLGAPQGGTIPIGHAMVDPSVWGDMAPEHPWKDPEEFWASAFEAFDVAEEKLQTSIEKAARVDPNVREPARELIQLLREVRGKKLLPSKLPKDRSEAAVEAAKRLEAPKQLNDIVNDPDYPVVKKALQNAATK